MDVGYHLRTADHILSGNGIPAVNTFSFTVPDEPWWLQQWLGTLVIHRFYAWGGLAGLIVFKALLGMALMLLVWGTGRQLAGPASWWPFWTATLGLLLARVRFFERPDLLSGALFALLILLDRRMGLDRRWQWIGLPAMFAVWANIHSGVIYGLAYLCVNAGADLLIWLGTGLGRAARPVAGWERPTGRPSDRGWPLTRTVAIGLAVLGACATVQAVNPNGCKVLTVPITQFLSPFWRSVILEYFPPTWANAPFFFVCLTGLAILLLANWKRREWPLILTTLCFGFLACRTQRSVLFFVIAAAPHAARLLEQVIPSEAWWQRQWQAGALVAAWVGLTFLVLVPDRTFLFGVGLYPPYYPEPLLSFIEKEVPPQHLFNEMQFGGPMLWRLYPRFRPYVDGRGDAYSEKFWKEEYLPVLSAKPGWQETLQRHDVHGAFLSINKTGQVSSLARALFASPDWALVAYSDDALLFLERTQTNRAVIAGNEFKVIWPGDWTFAALESEETSSRAADEIGRALKRAPESLFLRTAQARLDLKKGRFGEAAELLGALLRERGGNSLYWRDYGFALYRAGRLAEAEQVFNRMIRAKMLPGYAFYLRHFIALERRDLASARNDLQKAVESEPGNALYKAAMKAISQPASKP